MASTTAEVNDHDGQPSNPRDRNDELVNARVHVVWHPVTGDAADNADPVTTSSSTLTIPLILRVHYKPTLSQASFQLQLRGVALKKGLNKKSFYLFVPPERVESLTLVETEYSTLPGDNAYRLEMVLAESLAVVGPPSHGHQAGWPGGKGMTKKLISLAATLRFTLLVPTAAATKTDLLDFCVAISKPEGLRSLASLYQTKTLYGGAGGYIYPVKSVATPSSPRKRPEDLPAPSPESDVSTVPFDTPPRYCNDDLLPQYSDVETCQIVGKAPGKRESSRHPDPCPPSKRRGGNSPSPSPSPSPVDRDHSLAPHAIDERIENIEHSTPLQEGLENIVRLLVAQNQAQARTIEELRQELEGLKKNHADLEQQVEDTNQRQDNVERAVESLDCQVCALEENHNEVEKYREEMEDAVHTCVGDALRQLVTDVLEEIFDDMPPSVQDAIDDRIGNVVDKRFFIFRTKFSKAFEAE